MSLSGMGQLSRDILTIGSSGSPVSIRSANLVHDLMSQVDCLSYIRVMLCVLRRVTPMPSSNRGMSQLWISLIWWVICNIVDEGQPEEEFSLRLQRWPVRLHPAWGRGTRGADVLPPLHCVKASSFCSLFWMEKLESSHRHQVWLLNTLGFVCINPFERR